MSTDSPAKKERIERHLMRQRGAGVRTVSATFGFAFGSSAPSSQEHTPISVEPPAKRRKTILSNEILVANEPTDPNVKQGGADIATQTKETKTRKRWAPQDDDLQSISRSHNLNEDDSFIGGLKAARTAAKKSAKITKAPRRERYMNAEPESPTIKSKPRRRAAARAALGVADDLEEEGQPIDTGRRNVEIDPRISKQPNTSRRKREGPVEVISNPFKMNDPSTMNARPKVTAIQSKSKMVTQGFIAELSLAQSKDDAIFMDEGDQPEAKPRKPVSRKRKQCEIVAEVEATDEISDARKVKARRKDDPTADPTPVAPEIVNAPSGVTKDRAPLRATAAQQSVVKTTPESQRLPLKESDPNVTIHPASPDKLKAKEKEMASTRPKAAATVKPTERAQHDQARPLKRRKVQVRQDIENVESELQQSQDQPSSRAIQKTKQQKQSAVASTAPARDEDIDWLFQDPNIKQPLPLSRKKPALAKNGPRTPKKLADIDLDDLLSNVACFAKADSQKVASDGQTMQKKATKTECNTAKRRGRR